MLDYMGRCVPEQERFSVGQGCPAFPPPPDCLPDYSALYCPHGVSRRKLPVQDFCELENLGRRMGRLPDSVR